MPDDVCDLVLRCRAGDQQAMIDLVERFRGRVFGLCYRMLGQRQDAEDMAQEAFVRALRNIEGFDLSRELEPWLLAIAGNRCRTLLATRARRGGAQGLADDYADRTPDWQAARNLAEEVELALGGLRDEYRQAFVLFHEHECSYAEIAEAMECPVGTAKTWVHRARRELTERLQQRGVIEEPRHAVRKV